MNLAETPAPSLYAASRSVRSLTRSTPRRKKSPGRIDAASEATKLDISPGVRLPMLLPRNITSTGESCASTGNASRYSQFTPITLASGCLEEMLLQAPERALSLTSTGM